MEDQGAILQTGTQFTQQESAGGHSLACSQGRSLIEASVAGIIKRTVTNSHILGSCSSGHTNLYRSLQMPHRFLLKIESRIEDF